MVSELRAELLNLNTFSTLSPVPGFCHWLQEKQESDPQISHLLATLEVSRSTENQDTLSELQKPLMHLCAHYLVNEKRKNGPLNSVARFHLGNGARLERINWLGDVSEKGWAESTSLLVNYVYDLAKIEANHEMYANDGTIDCAQEILSLLENVPRSHLSKSSS